MSFRIKHVVALALGLVAAPAGAQVADPLIGDWQGEIQETNHGERTTYRIGVSIDLDREGRPVGNVAYDLDCAGVWTRGEAGGGAWQFEETITSGRDNCASHVRVELSRDGGNWRVRLRPFDDDQVDAQGLLERTQ